MRLIYILFFLSILMITSNAQNPLDRLLSIGKNEIGMKFVTSILSVDYLEGKDKTNLHYFEGGVLFIPKIKKEKRIDTMTLEIQIGTDSIINIKTNHSLQLSQEIRIRPKRADRNCISMNNGYVFQVTELNQPLRNETFYFDNYSEEEVKTFVNKYNQENHTKEYKINMPQELKWISVDSWNSEGMEELDLGVMRSVYKDQEGNVFVVFGDGYYTTYRMVLCCGGRFSGVDVENIQKVLKERGYPVSVSGYMDSKTKSVLTQFQKENNFHVGTLNEETLEALGLEYLLYR